MTAKSKNSGIISLKFILFLIVGLLCITSLLFVLLKQKKFAFGSPAYFFISNVSNHQATVSFVTPKKEKLCVIAYSLWLPSYHRSCEAPYQTVPGEAPYQTVPGEAPYQTVPGEAGYQTVRGETSQSHVHSIGLSGLFSNTTYRILVGRGIHWTSKFVEPMAGVINDPSYVLKAFPDFKTASKNIVVDQKAPILLGNIVDGQGKPDRNAVVIAQGKNMPVAVSTKANIEGRFALAYIFSSDVQLAVLGESGYFIVIQPIDITNNQIQTIKLTSYK